MKHVSRILPLFAALVLMAVSCNVNEMDSVMEDHSLDTLRAYLAPDTRLTCSEEGNVLYRSFSVGDSLLGCTKYYGKYQAFCYRITEVGENTLTMVKVSGASGVPSRTPGELIHFIYAPGFRASDISLNGELSLNISSQNPAGIPAIMTASSTVGSDNSVFLQFANRTAVLAVIPTELTVSSLPISHDCAASTLTVGGVVTTAALQASDDGISVKPSTTTGSIVRKGAVKPGDTAYVALFPGMSKISVSLSDVTGYPGADFSYFSPSSRQIVENAYIRLSQSFTSDIAAKVVCDGVESFWDSPVSAIYEAEKATSSATIQLLKDFTASAVIPVTNRNAKITLDLAGKTLTVKKLATTAADLVITDSSPEGTGTLRSATDRTVQVSSGKLTLENGIIWARDSSAVFLEGTPENVANFVMNGGTATNSSSVGANSSVYLSNSSDMLLTGGLVNSANSRGLYLRAPESGNHAHLKMVGGTIKGKTHGLYFYIRAIAEISGGTVMATSGKVVYNGTTNSETYCRISGGYFYATGYDKGKYFNGYNATSVAHIVITGGYFNVNPTAESQSASATAPLYLGGRYKVDTLAVPVTDGTNQYKYSVVRDTSSICVGISRYGGPSSKSYMAYHKCIEDAGAKVVFFDRYATDQNIADSLILDVDALIIPGSATADTSCRNDCEMRMINAARQYNRPVLGFCYGHQRINKYFGGNCPAVTSLAPNSPYTHKYVVDGENVGVMTQIHPITIDTTSTLYKVLGTSEIMVNSSHNYSLGVIGKGLRVVAKAPDGIVEAIETTTGERLWGVQFHPEYLYGSMDLKEFFPMFQFFISQAKEAQAER